MALLSDVLPALRSFSVISFRKHPRASVVAHPLQRDQDGVFKVLGSQHQARAEAQAEE